MTKIHLQDAEECFYDLKTHHHLQQIRRPQLQYLLQANITYDKDVIVMSKDFVSLINELDIDSGTKRLVNEIRDVEKTIRNTAAHNITYITCDVIQMNTGQSPEQILKKLRNLSGHVGIGFNENNMDTYDRLNNRIEEFLREPGK